MNPSNCLNLRRLLFLPFIFSSLLLSESKAANCRLNLTQRSSETIRSYEVVVPTEAGFEYHKVKTKKEVERLLAKSSPEAMHYVETLFDIAQEKYETIVQHLRPISDKFGAELEYRIKDAHSLEQKIIQRSRAFSAEGRMFSTSDLFDLIGTRLIVPTDSHLLALGSSPQVWARFLNLKPEQILNIEMKGQESECIVGRCYRATHIGIMHESGIRWEIQVVSKNMLLWMKWDHPRVYKNQNVEPIYKQNLKKYSLAWVKMIRAMEDKQMFKKPMSSLHKILSEFGLEVDLRSRDWLWQWDQQLINKFTIGTDDQFLNYQNESAKAALVQLSQP